MGPIQTQPHDLAPISHKLFESLESLGIPRDDDMFSKGVSAHGCGNTVRTVHDGLRSNATAYLSKKRRNLTVICQTTVLHILIDNGNSELKIRGVAVQDQIGGGIRSIHANQEVILSAGCYNSPHVSILCESNNILLLLIQNSPVAYGFRYWTTGTPLRE